MGNTDNAMQGRRIAGASHTRKRVEHDYYATPPRTTRAILDRVALNGSILEPACGEGHISKVLHEFYPHSEIVSTDLIQREDLFDIGLTGGVDFLTHDFGRKFDNVITNPPFSLSNLFVEKALSIVSDKVLMFGTVYMLGAEVRYNIFNDLPFKRLYVFTKRQPLWRNGEKTDEKGKRWQTTQVTGWFLWEKGYTGTPEIEWIYEKE